MHTCTYTLLHNVHTGHAHTYSIHPYTEHAQDMYTCIYIYPYTVNTQDMNTCTYTSLHSAYSGHAHKYIYTLTQCMLRTCTQVHANEIIIDLAMDSEIKLDGKSNS